ncbi:unnamed protein product [Arctia plantaginis]|uniref:L-lactate dehydrogenase n=1 Tax=Arctia plantaginis TaxID=874455 RepID=A0A8S1B8T6_ARCPL|nr:unnamed protein product [Arctia plantaginis]
MVPQFIPFIAKTTATLKALKIFNGGLQNYGFLPSYISSRHKKYETKDSRTLETENPCKQFTTVAKLFNGVSKKTYGTSNKVSVVGLDEIGIATVFALLAQDITDNVCLVDLDEDLLKGEQMDLEMGSVYHNNAKIISSKDPLVTSDSKICIIVTGTYKGRDEPEHVYVGRSVSIMKAIVPPLVKYSPNTILIVASDPVDILSYVTWKLSGFPKNRVMGTGTLLDTARFRFLLSQRMGISPENCHGYIIGSHGGNSVPVWSSVNIAGVPLKDISPRSGSEKDGENWQELHSEVVKCDEVVRSLKGYSAWSLALAIAHLCETIFSNSNRVLPVSTYVQGEHAIRDDVFLSLPCVIGENGVTDILRQPLTDMESTLLRRCAEEVAGLQEPAAKLI